MENSPFKVEYSLLKALMEDEEFKERYEIKIYNMSYFEKSANDPKCERKLQSLGIDIFDAMLPFYKEGFYHSHLSKAIFLREMILNDEVDILISAVGAYDICDFLLSTRCAPKQIYWSHGNHEYDIEGIDERICHFAPENHKYEFKQLTIPMDEEYLNPPVPKEKIEAEREKYPKDAFILGTIGRLVKVDSDEYLETVAKIMEQNPNTIYIAAGSGDSEGIRKKVERLGISERFYMPGFVDAHLYGHIIDLWLDTFPLSQGASRIEYIAKEKAFVSMISPPFGIEYLDKFMIQAKESDYMILSFVGEYSNSCVNGIKKVFDLCREKKVLFVINNKELFDNLANAFPEYLDKFEYLNIENKTLRQYADICFSTINDIFLVKSTNFIRKKHISCLNFDFVRRTDTSSIIIDNSDIFLYDDEYLHLFSKCFNTKEFFDTSDRLINDDNIRKKIINSQTFFNIKHSELVVKESVRFFTSL